MGSVDFWFGVYLSVGGTMMGIIMGMHFVMGKLPTFKRSLFILGAFWLWPLYLPYIWNGIEVRK